MASGDTKTQQYLDVAANGTRADLPSNTCCETRTQTLIRGVAERIMDVEDEVERLENNPDVADIVATYADLQSYPTSQLTDKDVIRVLQDETHSGDSTYYRWSTATQTWTYIGESKQYSDFVGTDGTAGGQNGLVPAPVATDAGKFLNANGGWEEIASSGVIELTSADYNYPTNNPNSVALWLLESGLYSWTNLLVRANSSTACRQTGSALVEQAGDRAVILTQTEDSSKYISITLARDGSMTVTSGDILTTGAVSQSTGSSATSVMSQNATSSMVYVDPANRTKIRVGQGSSVSGQYGVAIGQSAIASLYGAVALGYNAQAEGLHSTAIGGGEGIDQVARAIAKNSVAIGPGSRASQAGQFDIGSTGAPGYGYNSSDYRLLTGLYDPQNDHDAANKEYVDGLISALEARIAALEGN